MDTSTKEVLMSGWLNHVDAALAKYIVSVGRKLSFAAGQMLYAIGDQQPNLYCVVSGSVRFDVTMNEQPPRFGHLGGPGFWFGEVAFLRGSAALIEVSAATDAMVYLVNRQKFDAGVPDPATAWRAIAFLTSMNQALAIGIGDDLLIRNGKQRLCATLLRLAGRRSAFQGQLPLKNLSLTQSDLSTVANLSRSKTAEILRELSEKSLIKTTYGSIEILSAEGLVRELQ